MFWQAVIFAKRNYIEALSLRIRLDIGMISNLHLLQRVFNELTVDLVI